MEAHSAIPQPQQPPANEPISRKIRPQARVVKHRVTEPSAENHTERAIEEQIVGMTLCHRRTRLLDHPRQMPIRKNDPEQVSQRVKPQGEEPKINPWSQPEILPVDRICCAACSK